MALHPCTFALRKNISGFPTYSVSSNGEVVNLDKGKRLAFSINRNGYYSVRVCRDNSHTQKRYLLHRLVLSSFCGKIDGKIVDHIDHNVANNHLSNLQWLTQSENIKKSYASGRSKSPKSWEGKHGKLHHASRPIAGYDDVGKEVVRFESVGLAKKAKY